MAASFTDIPYPSADDDAANKKYVDDNVGGGGGGGGSGGFRGVNNQTGTTYSVNIAGDKEKLITLNNSAPVSVFLPLIGTADGYIVAPELYQFNDFLCLDVVNGVLGVGQSFTASATGDITKARFFLKRVGSPTGNAVAKLYAHTGTYGVSSIPGALLATSDNLDVSTISTGGAFTDLDFSSGYTLVSGTHYIITIEYAGPDISNYITPADTLSIGHSGQEIELIGPDWQRGTPKSVWEPIGSLTSWITASATTNLITTPVTHGLNAGDPVMLIDLVSGGPNIPSPLANGTQYFVAASGLTTTSFAVTYTNGGSPADLFTDAGLNAVIAYTIPSEPPEDLVFFVFTTAIDDKWLAYFENLGAGLVTINTVDSTIDGIASVNLRQDTGLIIACDGLGYYTSRGQGIGTETLGITVKVAGSDFTTASASLVNITGLSFPAIANALYELDIILKCRNSTTNGLAAGINYSAAGAAVSWAGTAALNAGNPTTVGTSTLNSPGGSFCGAANTDAVLNVRGILTTGSNAGNITVQIRQQASGTATVYVGSRMTVKKLN